MRPQRGLGPSQWSLAPLTLPDRWQPAETGSGRLARRPGPSGPCAHLGGGCLASEQTVNASGAGWPSMGVHIRVLKTTDAAVHARCQVRREAAALGPLPSAKMQ